MRRRSASAQPAEKFEPAPVLETILPVDHTLRRHLEAFVASFITPSRRKRWELILLHRAGEAHHFLYRFERDLDPRFCAELTGSASFPQRLRERYGEAPGI